jgi:glycosyltransferase involved in cell wall biosynthesis
MSIRIAYFADSLPPRTDGVSKTFVQLVNTLQSENLEYFFFSPFKPDDNYYWNERVEQVFSVPIFFYTDYRIVLPIQRKIFERLDNYKPDLIHATSPTFLGRMGLSYAKKRGIPAVSSYHTNFIYYFKYYGFSLFEAFGWNILKWFYNRFDRVYVPSQSTAKELSDKGFKKIELWQRGIDFNVFSPARRNDELRRQLTSRDAPILLYVGRLTPEKDLEDLVAVDRVLRARNQKFKMVIVGDGPMRTQLECDLPNATFTGFLYGESLAEVYASSDIFVFPSSTETFGNVVLEAYASGLPVIGVNEGGVVDLIKDGKTGFISPARDTHDIATKVNVLLNNTDLRREYSRNALKFAGQFSWDAINKQLISSYMQIVDQYATIRCN